MMKRRDFLNKLKRTAKELGVDYTITEGARHTRVDVGENTTHVPRHNEIGDMLARQIIKQAEGKDTQ